MSYCIRWHTDTEHGYMRRTDTHRLATWPTKAEAIKMAREFRMGARLSHHGPRIDKRVVYTVVPTQVYHAEQRLHLAIR